MRSLCVFNNKGGVGKTTLLCNLAAYFSIHFDETRLDRLYSSNADTVNSLITSLKRSKGYASVPTVRSEEFGVDIVPGSPSFSLAEDFLAKDWFEASSGQERGLRTTYLFRALLLWAEKLKYDYVFFDVGPSLGAINRTILLSCDYFVLPMSSDIFSLKGLSNIDISINSWRRSLQRGLDQFAEENGSPFLIDETHPVSNVTIQFLGYVTQQYTAKTVNGKKQPVKAYEKIIRKIEPAIKRHLIDSLNDGKEMNYKLGEIPYFQSLVPMSQTSTKPIFALKSADGIVGAHFDKVKQYDEVISGIAKSILRNMEAITS